jgi:hypothetical protein
MAWFASSTRVHGVVPDLVSLAHGRDRRRSPRQTSPSWERPVQIEPSLRRLLDNVICYVGICHGVVHHMYTYVSVDIIPYITSHV